MISEAEVSSSNPDRHDLLKKIKINCSILLLTFTPKRELHVGGVLNNKKLTTFPYQLKLLGELVGSS
jgi:hypothetical protein